MKKIVTLSIFVLLSLTACDLNLGGSAGVGNETVTPEPLVEETPIPQDVLVEPTLPVVVELPNPVGQIAFVSDREGSSNVYVMNADGGEVLSRLTNSGTENHSPQWSPVSSDVAFVSTVDNNTDIYIARSGGSNLVRLTDASAQDNAPSWSPDGMRIAFESFRDGNWEIYIVNADGTNLFRLTTEPTGDTSPAWSPAGNRIAFVSGRDGNSSIYMSDPNGGELTRLTLGDVPFSDPVWSLDGRWIAFRRWASPGLGDVCVLSPGLVDMQCFTSYQETGIPDWSPDGSKLVYRVKYEDVWQIEIANINDGSTYTLETASQPKGDPIWAPDGNWVGYQVDVGENMEIMIQRSTGGDETRLTMAPSYDGELSWAWR